MTTGETGEISGVLGLVRSYGTVLMIIDGLLLLYLRPLEGITAVPFCAPRNCAHKLVWSSTPGT